MDIKGVDKVREKLPKFSRRIKVLPIYGFFVLVMGFSVLIFFDVMTRILVEFSFLIPLEPILPLLGVILIEVIAIILVTGLWRNKSKWTKQMGELAYQHALPRGLTGVALLLGVLFHGYISVRSLPPGPPLNELTIFMSRSLLPLVGIPIEIELYIRLIFGVSLVILTLLTARRAALTFGVDYMLVVYLYFPEESEIQNQEIYSIIRHPTYFAGVVGGLGYVLLRFSIYSILFYILFLISLKVWIATEESELLERFGESYREYMRKVPGMYIRPQNVGAFLRYIIGRKK